MNDLISRQAAIDALKMDISIIPFAKAREYVRAAIETIYNRLEELPRVQPETHEECTETHACDCISRQAAIDAIEEYADRLQMVDWKENPAIPYKAHTLNWCINTIRDLPSAQPEIIRCKDCKHRPIATEADEGVLWGFSVEFPDEICPLQCEDEYYNNYPKDDFYCANAERRTNG